MTSRLFIAVAGNIGTGKTTLTKMLAEHYGLKPHFESVSDNPYLKDFYDDMARWSFPLQIYFLNHRFKVHKEIGQSGSSAIQDRSIYEDCHIFARSLHESDRMEKRDYLNYVSLYEEMVSHLDPPDLMIYLRKSTHRLKEQVAKRGRDFERNMPEGYLEGLNRYYDEWIAKYNKGKLLVVDSNELDFVAYPSHFDIIARQIFEKLDQKELFLPLAEATAR